MATQSQDSRLRGAEDAADEQEGEEAVAVAADDGVGEAKRNGDERTYHGADYDSAEG